MVSQHWDEREALQEGYRLVATLMSKAGREYAFIKRDLHPADTYIALLEGLEFYNRACVYIYVTDDQLKSLIQDADEDLMQTFHQGHPVFVDVNERPHTSRDLLDCALMELQSRHYTAVLCELMTANADNLLAAKRSSADAEIAKRIVGGCVNRFGPAIIVQVGDNGMLTSVDLRNIILPLPN